MAKFKLTRAQEWLIVVAAGLAVLAVVLGAYVFLMGSNTSTDNQETIVITPSVDEKDLTEVKDALDSIDDLDLSELDAIQEDLDSIEL